MPFQLLFGVLENTEELCDKLQSRCFFFFTLLIFSLVFWCSDGATQALGTCLRDFRNKPYPIRAKITYYKKTLTVRKKTLCSEWRQLLSERVGRGHSVGLLAQLAWSVLRLQVMINNGFTPNKDDYEFCTKVVDMIIPTEGFFGISAATGGLAGSLTVLNCAYLYYYQSTFNLCRSEKSLHSI